jgi:hypothetical protein
MNALTPTTIERLPALMDADLGAADDYLRAEKSPGRRRTYTLRRSWRLPDAARAETVMCAVDSKVCLLTETARPSEAR